MMRYDIVREPKGDLYDELLRTMAQCASYFILVTHPDSEGPKCHDVTASLQEWLVKKTMGSSWPGTISEEVVEILTYRVSPDSVGLLVHLARGLYDWVHPNKPEDLSFLREDGSPVLVTIAHEEDAYIDILPAEDVIISALCERNPGVFVRRSLA